MKKSTRRGYILQHSLTVVSTGLLMSAVPRTLESSVPLRQGTHSQRSQMKCVLALFLAVGAVNVSPIEKTMQLLDGLIAKITKEGKTPMFLQSYPFSSHEEKHSMVYVFNNFCLNIMKLFLAEASHFTFFRAVVDT